MTRSKSTKTTRTGTSTGTQAAASTPPPSAHPSLFIGIVGIGFLAFFALGIMMQVQTNEALITHAGNVNIYQPDWSIFLQVPELIFGGFATSSEAAGAFAGWGIELLYLGFIIGYEHLEHATGRSGRLMARVFRFCSFGILGFNVYTDYKYGDLGGGPYGHLLFAIVVSFVVGFFGTIGMRLLEMAQEGA